MPANQIIDKNGQISLGKKYAGRKVIVEEVEKSVWQIKVIPHNELWLHTPEMRKKLDRGIAWAMTHEPKETDLDELEKRILGRHRRST